MRVALALIAACSGRGQPAPPVPHGVADAMDRCPTLPPSCLRGTRFHDDDGCPEAMLEIPFGRDSSAIPDTSARMLQGIAQDAHKLLVGMRILVGGESSPGEPPGLDMKRALVVVSALRSRGVAANLLEAGLASQHESRPSRERRVVITCEDR